MDPLTQGLVGAVASESVADRKKVAVAGLLGCLSGMAPDLDVLIQSSEDSLLFLEYHRQFTHSLLFIPFGAFVCAAVLFPFVRTILERAQVYLFCLLGYATHGLLDSCTSYGTQLFWPFSDYRVAWNNISIVDPLFTVPLLAVVIAAARRKSPRFARAACVFAIGYLLIGVAQRERAEAVGQVVASERGHALRSVEAKPAFGSLLLWKTIYEHDNRYYVDAVRIGFTTTRYPGQDIAKLDVDSALPWLRPGSQQARDIERFRWFSDGFIAADPKRADHIIDIRYSMRPDRIDSLWGIRLSQTATLREFAHFYTARDFSSRDRSEVLRMIFE